MYCTNEMKCFCFIGNFAWVLKTFNVPFLLVVETSNTQRRRGAMCSGTSDPSLSPTEWPLRQVQVMNFFNFYKLSEKISDFQSSFSVFTIFSLKLYDF